MGSLEHLLEDEGFLFALLGLAQWRFSDLVLKGTLFQVLGEGGLQNDLGGGVWALAGREGWRPARIRSRKSALLLP
jgi:hypothetical protein